VDLAVAGTLVRDQLRRGTVDFSDGTVSAAAFAGSTVAPSSSTIFGIERLHTAARGRERNPVLSNGDVACAAR
jgi:hypothetical protein